LTDVGVGDITFPIARLLVIVDWVYREERRNTRREALEDAEAARAAAMRSS
jgi:hypothetical protein